MTSSLSGALTGSQRPRVLTRPPFTSEAAGQEAIDLAESVGLRLDPWQQLIVRVALAEGPDGLYAARELGYLVARQNGKGGALEAIALHGLFLVNDPLTLWTAHQFKTSSEAFLRVRGWIDGSDELRPMVRKINAAHGEEGIELSSGARLRFLARSKSSGRGFSPQRIIFDEAQELAKVAAEAMLPSMRAQRNRQAIYTGTVPGPEINNPEHWTRLRDRGREGKGRLAWLEWSPKGSEDPVSAAKIELDSVKVWAASNPGLGFRDGLGLESLEADREALDDDSFARECCSIWPKVPEVDLDALFGPGNWQGCKVEGDQPEPAAIGVALSMDRQVASIGACSEGGLHLGSVEKRAGTAGLVAEVKRIQDERGLTVAVAENGPAADLIDDLEAAGVAVFRVSAGDYLDACADLFDAVVNRDVQHGDYDDLNEAVGSAEKRFVSERGFAWGRKGGDVSMLEAVTLARLGAIQGRDFWGAIG